MTFEPGATAVRRDTFAGRVWTAAPYRVLRDRGGELMLVGWPGIRSFAPTTWIEWQRTGDDTARKRALPNLASQQWDLGEWTWQDTIQTTLLTADEYFSVSRFTAVTPALRPTWYVNFERPFQRTDIGIDTFDLLLDLVVGSDLSWHTWKDEDEYTHARRLGLIDDTTHRHVDEARQRVLSLIQQRQGPFAEKWPVWDPFPTWPTPVLPPTALTLPAAC